MDRTAGPVIAIILMIAIAAGAFAFYEHTQVAEAQAGRAAAEHKLAALTQQNESATVKLTEGTTALNTCQTQLQEANAKVEAAEQSAQTKSGGGKRK